MVTYRYYCLFILLWKLLVFNFAVMPEPFTLEWIRSVFTTLIWLSWNPSNLCTTCLELLQNVLMWFIFVLSLHLLPYARHLWGGWLDPHYLHELIWLICFSGRFVSTVCVLLATSCFAHISACFLVIFACISCSCKLTVHLYLHVVIIYTMDKLPSYPPIKFLIIALFYIYS